MKSLSLLLWLIVFTINSNAQVGTNFNNSQKIGVRGIYSQNFRDGLPYTKIPW
jgi:hypothetical protein